MAEKGSLMERGVALLIPTPRIGPAIQQEGNSLVVPRKRGPAEGRQAVGRIFLIDGCPHVELANDGRLIAGENRLDEWGFLRRVLCAHHPPLARQEIVHGDDREQGQ